MMDVEMRMPELATVDATVPLVRWLVEVGRPVRRGDPLVEVETDKSILVVESAVTGTLLAIAVPAGSEVAPGQVIATFDAEGRGEGVPAAGSEAAPVLEASDGPIAGAAGVASGMADLAATGRAGVAAGATGERRSFFSRNRSARAGVRPASAPAAVDAAAYPREFLMDLYRRMVLIREFEEGVKFL